MDEPVHLIGNAGATAEEGAALADALLRLDVPFLAGGSPGAPAHSLAPRTLLANLATSPEARLRLALIPLLLRHPAYAADVDLALGDMPAAAVTGFQCYVAAAALLQRKYWERLRVIMKPMMAIPPCFFAELALPYPCDPDDGLKLLASRQTLLSGRNINWLGTYEHAAQRLIMHMERCMK